MAQTPDSSPDRTWPRRSVLGGTGLALTGLLAGCAGGSDAGAATESSAPPALPNPEVVPTAEWGAVRPEHYLQTLYQRPSYLVIHHTTTPNVTDGSMEAAAALAKQIQTAHINQGWGDSGQHFTVSRGGHALEARHGSRYALEKGQTFILGVHALGFNA